VQAVVKQDGQWVVDPKYTRVRTHTTHPSKTQIASGPVERAPAPDAEQVSAKAPEVAEIDHNGTRIYKTKIAGRNGAPASEMWAVESQDNKRKQAAGQRTTGGDSLHATLDEAKKAADVEAKQDAAHQDRIAEADAEQAAAQAKKDANKGKSIVERRKDAILDGATKLPVQAGLGNGTKRESMQKAVDQERAIVEKMVDDTAAKKRDNDAVDLVRAKGFILGLSNENLPVVKAGLEAQARLKANDYKKPSYRVHSGRDTNSSFYEISKTEYDYAQSLKAAPKDPRENYIKSAADSIGQLRKSDVDRVLSGLAKDNIDGVTRADLASYIKEKHPDYAQEVDDVMAELSGTNLEPHQMTEAQYGEQERQKNLVTLRSDLQKAKSGETKPYVTGAKSKAELVRNIEAEIAKTEQAPPERYAGDHLGHINQALRDGKTVPDANLKRYDVQPGRRAYPSCWKIQRKKAICSRACSSQAKHRVIKSKAGGTRHTTG